MVHVVLFDLGNVILPFDVNPLAEKLSKSSPLSPQEILQNLWPNDLSEELEKGELSPQDYFEKVSQSCHFKDITFDQFVPLFNNVFIEDKRIANLLPRLKPSNKLGLISNTNAIHATHIMEQYPSMSLFDRIWFSNEVGVRKPARNIYQFALDFFQEPPSSCVFIDDMQENVDGAKALGINSILYKDSDNLEKQLTALGVQITAKAA